MTADDTLLTPAQPPVAPEPLGARPTGSGPERTSSYTVYVDLEGEPEHMLLVHTYTGAFDRVSRRLATWLRAQEVGPPPKPLYGSWTPEPVAEAAAFRPSDAALEGLRRRGYLTTTTREQEADYFARIASKLHFAARMRQPQYVLMTTYQCNLRCPYCFQDHMRTDPKFRHLLQFMDGPTLDRIWRGMDDIDRLHGLDPTLRQPRDITLFGGEPLLREARPMIDQMFAKLDASGGGTVFAVTNATDLDAYEDLLRPDRLGALQITIDGPKAKHDQRRIYADGSGSYDRIARNVSMALDRGVTVHVRMNVDRTNIDDLPALVDDMERFGWTTSPRFHPYVSPVYDPAAPKTTVDSWQLGKLVEQLKASHPNTRILSDKDDQLETRVRRMFSERGDPGPSMKSAFCGAHTTMFVVDAFCDLYACWERTGDARVRIGTLTPEGELRANERTLAAWRGRHVASNPTCAACRYATFCGGGCAAYAEDRHGTQYHNFCDGFGKRFRKAVGKAWVAHRDALPVPDEVASPCAE